MFRRHTYVLSDQKPLLSIILKDLINALPRLKRMLLCLQKYNVTIMYRKGSEIVFDDHLSRNLDTKNNPNKVERLTEHDKLTVANVDLNVSKTKLTEIKDKTGVDPELIHLSKIIVSGWLDREPKVSDFVKPYWNFRDEFSMLNGIVLKGSRIVIPKAMRTEVLNQLHNGHLGQSKCKLMACSSMYWPGINAAIDDLVATVKCVSSTSQRTLKNH